MICKALSSSSETIHDINTKQLFKIENSVDRNCWEKEEKFIQYIIINEYLETVLIQISMSWMRKCKKYICLRLASQPLSTHVRNEVKAGSMVWADIDDVAGAGDWLLTGDLDDFMSALAKCYF